MSELNIKSLVLSDELAGSQDYAFKFEIEEFCEKIEHIPLDLSHFGQFTSHGALFMEKYRFCLMY